MPLHQGVTLLSNFFLLQGQPEHLLHVRHDSLLVILSIAVAIAASVLALYLVQAGMHAPGRFQRQVALLCGCGTLGQGIWSMHFIGMLALELPVDVHYHLGVTLASMLPGLFASWLALRHLLAPQSSLLRLLAAGVVVGMGIALMHYSGMSAMHMSADLRYDPWLFAASLAVAILMAVSALVLWNRMVHRSHSPIWQRLVLPSVVLGGAITGMHYISMSAARFVGNTVQPGLDDTSFSHGLALLVIGICAVMFGLMALASAALRYRGLWLQVQRSESRLQTMASTAVDAVITIDGQGLVQSFNPAAERIFGWKASDIIGRNLKLLMPSALAEQHDGYLERYHQNGERRIVGTGREVLGMHKNGRHIPLRLSIGQADTPDGPVFVGFAYDLTERKRTEAQLRIAASVFDHTCEGIAIIDANHLVVETNPAFVHLTGLSRAECVHTPFDALYQGAKPAINMPAIWQAVTANGNWQGEVVLPRADGSDWTQRLSLTAVLNEHKRLTHYVAVISDVSLHPRAQLALEHKALYDSVTGLPNELLLIEHIAHAIPSAKRNSTQLAVISIDFDHFHRINEIHGRSVGDELLEKVAYRIRGYLRGEDTLARGRSDELVVVLAGLKDEEGLHIMCNRLIGALQLPVELSSIVIQVSASCGWALYPRQGHTAATLLAAARLAQHPVRPAGSGITPAPATE